MTSLALPTVSITGLSMLAGPTVPGGGIFVTATLTFLLGYLNIVVASDRNLNQLQSLLVVATVPLLIVFVAIILLESLSVIGFV